MKLITNYEKMNAILKNHGLKKANKAERLVHFNISHKDVARDFIWHLKRIHHWWNCSGKDNEKPVLGIKFK